MKWYFAWARRFTAFVAPRPPEAATRADAESFPSILSSRPGIVNRQLDQAADALTILLGRVFGQDWARAIRIPAPLPLPMSRFPMETTRRGICDMRSVAADTPGAPNSRTSSG